MNLDRRLICGILQDEDELPVSDRIRLVSAVGHRFAELNEPVYKFVFQHYQEFRVAPARETMEERYPNFPITSNPEPFKYYLDEAVKLRQTLHVRNTISAVEDSLAAGKLEEAISKYTASSRQFEVIDVKSRDMEMRKSADEFFESYRVQRDSGDSMGISTGFPTLDEHTFGIHAGEFWVLSARPGSYKTWILCKMFAHCAATIEGSSALFFSKEMTREQIFMRVAAIVAGVPFSDLRRHKFTDEQLDAVRAKVDQLASDAIIIGRDYRWNYDLSYIQSKILEYKPSITFIDGMYLMADTADWNDVTNFTRGVRDVALMTEVPIVGTTQLNRNNRVMYSDSFEQDASVLLGLERTYDDVLERYRNEVTLTEKKIRDEEDGRKITISLKFDDSSFIEGEASIPSDDDDDWQNRLAAVDVRKEGG